MKKILFFFFIFILIPISTQALQIIESYKLESNTINQTVNFGDYDISAYGTIYSVNEWWQNQPTVTLEYEGEEKFFNEIKEALQSIGFVLGRGERLYVKTEMLQDRFLYIETVYDSKEVNNVDSLMILDHDNNQHFRDFFLNVYGDFRNRLPKLILIKGSRFFETNGDIIYQGPEYTIVKTFAERLTLDIEGRILEFDIPFYPILFLDLTQNQYLLTIKTDRKQTITVDGEHMTAPVSILLVEGVHELEYAGQTQFLYMKNDMEVFLDEVDDSEMTITLNVSARVMLFKEEKVVKTFEDNHKKMELQPGTYQIVIEKEGYRRYEETFTVSSSESLKRDVELIPVPGTVIYQMKLSESYTNLFFEGQNVILTRPDKSVLINLESEEITGNESNVVWFDGNIIVTGNTIVDTSFETLWSGTELIINVIKTQGALWLFTSSKKVISIDVKRWVPQWTRSVDYLAYKIVSAGSNICILDPYSRVILINSEIGYRDYFNKRIPGITDILFAETTKEKISIYLQGYRGYIDYYFKSRTTDLRKGERENLKNEYEKIGTMLYQDGEPLVALSGSLIKAVKKQNHLAILTDEEMVVCTTY